MISKHIKSIGVELEGGIDSEDLRKFNQFIAENRLKKYYKQEEDGSVSVPRKYYGNAELTFWHSDIETILNVVRFLYKECNFVTNDSCGLHIHIKLEDDNQFGLFTFKKFLTSFMKEYKSKYKNSDKFLKRIKENYCKATYKKSFVEHQLKSLTKDGGYRYTAINLNSFNLYGTVEFRIFPHQEHFTEFKNTLGWFVKTVEVIFKDLRKKNIQLFSTKIDIESLKTLREPEIELFTNYNKKILKEVKVSLGKEKMKMKYKIHKPERND